MDIGGSRLTVLSKDLAARRTLPEVLTTALDAAIALLHADFGNIQLYRAGMLTIAAHRGFKPEFLDYFRRVEADDDTACACAMREGRAVVVSDIDADSKFMSLRPVAAEAGFRAVQSTPLVTTSGLFMGMLSTHFAAPHTPTTEDMTLLGAYATVVADTIQKLVTEKLIGTLSAAD